MGQQGLHAGPRREDLGGTDTARGGVAVARGCDVAADLLHHPADGSKTEHSDRVDRAQRRYGVKNGSEM